MNNDASWREMLDEFRVLGGTAENICMREGPRGRGLFALDPSRPAVLLAPENLLLPAEEAQFRDGAFFVAPESRMAAREKAWLERYENEFSWGHGGRTEAEAWLEPIWALPGEIREKLAQQFGMPYCAGEQTSAAIQKRFLESRTIERNGRKVVMPIIELVNHDSGARAYDLTRGVGVSGTFADEILVSYCENDAFGLFQNFGFLSEERIAFSRSLTLNRLNPQIRVVRELMQGQVYSLKGPPDMSVRLPNISREEGRIRLSFLMIGNRISPTLPRSAFHRAFRAAGMQAGDEIFDVIRHMNVMLFLDLLASIEKLETPFAVTLRTMCRFQLEAISHCFGTREI
jgi:hypothetical protein